MKRYELEIPLRWTKKFENLEEAKRWAVRLMFGDIVQSNIYMLNDQGERKKICFEVYKNGEVCPKCKVTGEIVTLRKIGQTDQDISSCRHCGLLFKPRSSNMF